MLTKDLHKAYTQTEKLAASLERDEWEVDNLTNDLEWANNKVEQVIQSAINDTISRLQGYEEAAKAWASNEMRDSRNAPININKEEQRKSSVQLKRIQKTIAILKEMIE